jgi:endonuclease YncB( thermonuclease family)
MKGKFLNIIAVIFVGVFFGAILQSANSNNSHKKLPRKSQQNFDKEFSGKTSVIDGDSIRVDGKEVRLLGIDAPEYRQTCFDKEDDEYACGKISSKFLRKLANKKTAKCLYSGKDVYNRYLAHCFIGDISINNEILKNGMAVIYDFTRASEKEIELEKFAKNNKLGIWQGAFQIPKEYRRANPR